MSNLVNYNKDGLELVIDTQTGETFASASAIARMVSTGDKTIQATQIIRYGETLKKALTETDTKIAEIVTNTGLKTVTLYNERAIREFAKKYNPDLLDKFAEAGIRVFLHQLAGYEVKSTAIEQQTPPPRQLPPQRDTIEYIEATQNLEKLKGSIPHALYQVMLDRLGDELLTLNSQKQLPEPKERWLGLAQKAEELGFNVNSSNRVKLGFYGTKQADRLSRKQEERLCNGMSRPIWVYLDTKELETVIREFFAIEQLG